MSAPDSPTPKPGPKAAVLAVVGLLAGLVIGTLAGTLLAPPPPQAAARTFTLVAYHWGFAIYDEAGNEVPGIQVAKGTKVTLLAIGSEALSAEIHEEYEEALIASWANRPEYGNKNETEIMEMMHEAEESGLMDHSVRIAAYGIDIRTDSDSPTPGMATFVADQPGSFEIECSVACGWGHVYMKEQTFVVT